MLRTPLIGKSGGCQEHFFVTVYLVPTVCRLPVSQAEYMKAMHARFKGCQPAVQKFLMIEVEVTDSVCNWH